MSTIMSNPTTEQANAAPEHDPVTRPAHYTTGKIEVIDFIEDQQLGYHLGNVVKYITRAPHKGAPLQDLQKARWYLDRAISMNTPSRLTSSTTPV